jgi:hypothetical protein
VRGIRALAGRKLGGLRPWAWSPDSLELLQPLFANLPGTKHEPARFFNDDIAQLYSKAWSAAFLRKLLSRTRQGDEFQSLSTHHASRITSPSDWLCTGQEVGVPVSSLTSALETIAAIRARGHHKIVVKQAVGLAGSNAIRLFEPELLETHRRWMANSLAVGQQLVVEPWLERVVDFSVQLEMTPVGLKVCGYTGLLNDAKGQFQGNWAESHHHTRIPARVVAAFREPSNLSRLMLQLYADIFASLEVELRQVYYFGPLGIDAFVYHDAGGAARLKPVVEINPRYTMGRVMVELMRQACQGSCGVFRLVNRAALRAESAEDFAGYARALSERFPLRLEGDSPRIREGELCLNDPASAQVCLAVFQVTRSLDPLFDQRG